MILAREGSTLISCSEDGILCFWEVKDFFNKIDGSNNPYSDDIIVKWSRVERILKSTKKAETDVTLLMTQNKENMSKLKTVKYQELEDLKTVNLNNYLDAVNKINVIYTFTCINE